MNNPFFSIIAPDFEDSVSVVRLHNFISSVLSQYHWNWELLVIHDGPRKNKIQLPQEFLEDKRISFLESTSRFNDWGHTLRQLGASSSKGRYLIFCNADTVLYEECLSVLYSFTQRDYDALRFINVTDNKQHEFQPSNKVILYGVKMRGNVNHSLAVSNLRQRGYEHKYTTIITGAPPLPTMVDAMQMCCERNTFMENGGWYDKTEASDGAIISDLCSKNGYVVVPEILGEHW